MADYRVSNDAREDLTRIHQYGARKFGMEQADRYFHVFFECFDRISNNPYHFESVDYIRMGYHRCVCGVDSIYYRVHNNTVDIISVIERQEIIEILK